MWIKNSPAINLIRVLYQNQIRQLVKNQNNMKEETIEAQTRMYLYDLMNTAKEFGFKADDNWELSLVTDTERIKIQKDYYPTIAQKVFPEILLQVFHLIKLRLNQSLNKEEESMSNRSVVSNDLSYIVAFNPKRQRT